MSRSPRRRKGRPYQPLPQRPGGAAWGARLLVLAVGILLILGSLALFGGLR
ncbi:MAG TPA: hypothetical protein VFV59_04995 [Candidatus Limnocylindria bacterium]|nr:hypothetical protein [Candidatus Limnocylindria bacterium]